MPAILRSASFLSVVCAVWLVGSACNPDDATNTELGAPAGTGTAPTAPASPEGSGGPGVHGGKGKGGGGSDSDSGTTTADGGARVSSTTPRCQARQCGPDGNGGSCGSCNTSFATCDDNLGLCVPNASNPNASVAWQGACWMVCPANPPKLPNGQLMCDPGKRYQAMQLSLTQSTIVEFVLYFSTNCDPASGTDNGNDFGNPDPAGGRLDWFIHHPDERQTSAVWWAGHNSSGCVDYSKAPDCP